MCRLPRHLPFLCLTAGLALAAACSSSPAPPRENASGASSPAPAAGARSTRYEDLLSLFGEWRSVQRPKLVDGAPDYSPASMAAQHRDLTGYQARLARIDSTAWPAAQQVDYYVVRAEMNGLDFDHRVLKPWAANPGFYVTVFTDESDQPAREGPFAAG